MTKLPLTITLMVFAAALIMGLMVIDRNASREAARLEAQTLALARAVAAAGGSAVVKREVWALYRTLDQLVVRTAPSEGEAPVIDAAFLDPDGIVLAHTNAAAHPVGLPLATGGDLAAQQMRFALEVTGVQLLPAELRSADQVDAVVPIRMDDTDVGVLMLRSSTLPMQVQLRKDAWLVLAFALGLALVTSTLGVMISRRMVSPLRGLAAGLAAVSRGSHDEVAAVPPIDRDEIGQLAEQFNHMLGELGRIKRLERDLANAERLAGLGRFAAGLAHEVNNPLAGMKNCVNILSRRPDDADLVRKYVPLLDTGLNRISATIQSLLGELRGETRLHPCGMGCLGDLEGIVRAEIGERPIVLEWAVGTNDLEGLAISCNCPHLHQIVLNLTRNALAVMPEGGRLAVATERVGKMVAISVTDSGPGLDAKAQAQLFEPFYTTSPKGHGLGLWITYSLIQRMGGSIRVDSAPGKGARFTVTLAHRDPGRAAQAGV